MGTRNAQLAWLHEASRVGTGSITVTTGTEDPTTPKARLVDRQGLPLYRVAPDTGTVQLDLDRGAGSLEAMDRWLMPSGHNLDGETVEIVAADDSGFTSNVATLFGPSALSGTGLLDTALTASAQRHIRLEATGLGGDLELTQLWYTRRRQLTQGVRHEWTRQWTSHVLRIAYQSGRRLSEELGSQARALVLGWQKLPDADFAILDEMRQAIGGIRDPIWIWTPDDAEPAYLMELESDPAAPQRSSNPGATGPRYDFTLEALERIL